MGEIKIKVGDVLKTTDVRCIEVRYVTDGWAACETCDPERPLVTVRPDGSIVGSSERVIIPPPFDWSCVPEWTGINALAMDRDGVWMLYYHRDIVMQDDEWFSLSLPSEGHIIPKDKLPDALRNYTGPWQEGKIVRPE